MHKYEYVYLQIKQEKRRFHVSHKKSHQIPRNSQNSHHECQATQIKTCHELLIRINIAFISSVLLQDTIPMYPLLHCLSTRGGHKSCKAQNVDTYKQTNKTHYILQYTAASLPPQGHNWLTSRFLFFLSPPCGSILSFLLLSKQITWSPIHQWISILFKNQFFKPIHKNLTVWH